MILSVQKIKILQLISNQFRRKKNIAWLLVNDVVWSLVTAFMCELSQVHNQEMTLAAAGAWYRISLFSVTTQLINVIANVITRQ